MALRRLAALTITFAAALPLATTADARAQNLPPMDFSLYDPLLHTIGIGLADSGTGTNKGTQPSKGKKRSKPKAPKRPTAKQRRTLRFVPKPSITEAIYADVAARTGHDLAFVTTELDGARTELRRVLTKTLRWSGRDLGDVLAFGLLQAYSHVRGVDRPPKRGLAWLRRAVGDDLARDASVRRLSDAKQQRVAESCELRTIFLISGLVGARQAGDTVSETAARAEFRSWAKEVYGVDVARVRLASTGFVRAR